MRLLPIWTLALAGLLLTNWPAVAQTSREAIELRNQIYELQQQVQALRQQVGQGGGSSYLGQSGYPPPQSGGGGNDLVPQLLTQVQSLESQVRDLRGRVDQLQNQMTQQNADLNKRIGDLAFQMQNGGQAPSGATGEALPPAGPTREAPGVPQGAPPNQFLSPRSAALGTAHAPGTPPAVPRTPELALRDGELALARRDYPAAEASARQVLSHFRTSPRAYDAQYLLAEALAGQRQFAQSAIAYDDTYNRNRKGAHAPEALIGLAYSLSGINEKRAACDTLSKLRTEFPHQAAEIRQAAVTVGQRAGCK
jgi:TolA-binding protein